MRLLQDAPNCLMLAAKGSHLDVVHFLVADKAMDVNEKNAVAHTLVYVRDTCRQSRGSIPTAA